MILGGEVFPERRYIWWNFVSTSQEKIDEAKALWKNNDFPEVINERERIDLPEGDDCYLWFAADFLQQHEADVFTQELKETVTWQEESYSVYGKLHKAPRLTAWYGEPGASYTYSGVTHEPLPWTSSLQDLRERIQQASGWQFNSVLLNLYRNERDSVGWHADDEPELGPAPLIASLSLGETRRFRLKPKDKQSAVKPLALDLPSGSLLMMSGGVQRYWQHKVPKESRQMDYRINLTFRKILAL